MWTEILILIFTELNSMAQKTMMPTVPISVYLTIGTDGHVQMFRPSDRSGTNAPVFSSQASLVLMYQSIEGMKG
ncbi:hypothetical protein TNCV_4926741 [Trichonephila clavipes]|nr:hypothetical protein TNCV_4926741 [Trichonephila clavipes]